MASAEDDRLRGDYSDEEEDDDEEEEDTGPGTGFMCVPSFSAVLGAAVLRPRG